MARLIGTRVLHAVPLFLAIVTFSFLLLELAPGDVVTALVGDYPADQAYLDQMRERLGLDQPMYERYLAYLGSVLTADLGYSFANQQPVLDLVVDRLGSTLLLSVTALVIAVAVGITAGVVAGIATNGLVDRTVTVVSVTLFSMPVFWLGQLLLLLFAIRLGWFPVQGMNSLRGGGGALDTLHHLVLPAVAMAAPEAGLIARITRTSVRETLAQHYVMTGKSKGLSRLRLIRGHVLRNAMLPVITVVGYASGFLLAGTVLVETVFGWPGVGSLLQESVIIRDNSVVIGILLIVGITVLVINLLTDIAYSVVNPKIRYGAMQ